MKILLTGSSGFIGSALKQLFEEKSVEIVPFDIKDNPINDVRDFNVLQSKTVGIDGIIHLAAVSRVKQAHENPLECIETNIGGIVNVLESARTLLSEDKSPWVIFASSREVYGEPAKLPVYETSNRKAINVYGVSKLSGEELCKVYAENYRLKTRILRFSNVYTGIYDHLDRVVPRFIFNAINNKDLVINGSGEEIFDFTYITDTILGIWGCIQEIERNSHLFDDFNISTGIPVSLKELAEVIIEKTKSSSRVKFTESSSYYVNKFYADPGKAVKILGFSPNITIDVGIDLAVKELKSLK